MSKLMLPTPLSFEFRYKVFRFEFEFSGTAACAPWRHLDDFVYGLRGIAASGTAACAPNGTAARCLTISCTGLPPSAALLCSILLLHPRPHLLLYTHPSPRAPVLYSPLPQPHLYCSGLVGPFWLMFGSLCLPFGSF